MSTLKPTVKDLALRFVESQPGAQARFTDIQRFVYDLKHGAGAYDLARQGRVQNPNRGYFSCAFYVAHGTWPWSRRTSGYFITGPNRLVKQDNGLYAVYREVNN